MTSHCLKSCWRRRRITMAIEVYAFRCLVILHAHILMMEVWSEWCARMIWLVWPVRFFNWIYSKVHLIDHVGSLVQLWRHPITVSKLKYLQVRCRSYVWALRSFQMFTGPLLQIKLLLPSTCFVLLSGFQSSPELWNPLSKAVPGRYHGSGRHSKCKCLHDWASFHTSQAWQIVVILKTVTCMGDPA